MINIKNKIFMSLICLSGFLSFIILFFFIGIIFVNGIESISIDFLTSASKNFGSEGGILYQIIGSLIMIVVTALISFPISFGIALLKSEYLQNSSKFSRLIDIYLHSLNTTPSIIFGLFGLIFFINILGFSISWFVGSIILAIMIIPSITFASYQAMNTIPDIYRETAYALGFSKIEVINKVIIPQSFRGTLSGLLLSLARAIGETAPIMFIATVISGITLPTTIYDPCVSLPTHILSLAQNAVEPQAIKNAWGAALVLILIVLFFNGLAYFMHQKFKKGYY